MHLLFMDYIGYGHRKTLELNKSQVSPPCLFYTSVDSGEERLNRDITNLYQFAAMLVMWLLQALLIMTSWYI